MQILARVIFNITPDIVSSIANMTAIVWLIQLLAISVTFSKYVYIKKKTDWFGAHSHCRQEYTDLAPVNDESDIDLLRKLAGVNSNYIWFGIRRNLTDKSKFWWSGGGEVKTFFWDDGQPNPSLTEDYGIMRNYRWHDTTRYGSSHFFCFSVHVVREEKTWADALEHCRKNHKDLVSISSETEMMLIQRELLDGGSSERVWMGLRFLAGEWLWLDGSKAGFEAWGKGGKAECPGEGVSCGALVVNGSVWEAHDCKERLHFICY